MLKNSARNWRVTRSDNLVSLMVEKSTFQKNGPVSTFVPKSPNSPTGGIENALGLNHSVSVPVTMLFLLKPVQIGPVISEQVAGAGLVESIADVERNSRMDGCDSRELPSFEQLMDGESSVERNLVERADNRGMAAVKSAASAVGAHIIWILDRESAFFQTVSAGTVIDAVRPSV